MAVIGVTRNVRLRRRGASGFGFSLRGGREYAAGFYVSDVQPGSEAHRNGLRVGDQIIRVNGYPVEDAVHQEVALLAKKSASARSQDSKRGNDTGERQPERSGHLAHGAAATAAATVQRNWFGYRAEHRSQDSNSRRREGSPRVWRLQRHRARPHRSGYERRRAGEGSWLKSRRHYNLVQRPTAHRSSIRESHRGDEKLRGSRPDSATTHAESPLRLPRTTLDPWLERLRLRNVERRCSQPAAAKSFLLAPASPRSKDASSISPGRCLQSKWKDLLPACSVHQQLQFGGMASHGSGPRVDT